MATARNSSTIESFGFSFKGNSTSEVTLRVWFKNKNLYEYYNVPYYVYLMMLFVENNNDSVGQFFNNYIKPYFEFTKCN